MTSPDARGLHLVRRRSRLRDRRRPCSRGCSRGGFRKVLDRIDAGLARGAHRRDPAGRQLRACSAAAATGPVAIVRLHELAVADPARHVGLGRLVQGLGAGRMVEPGPGAAVRPVHAQCRDAGRGGAGEGAVEAGQLGSRIACAPTIRARARAQHRPSLRSRERFLRGLARSRHDLFERGLRRPPRRAAGGRRRSARSACCSTGSTSSPASTCSRSAAAGAASPRSRRAITACASPA